MMSRRMVVRRFLPTAGVAMAAGGLLGCAPNDQISAYTDALTSAQIRIDNVIEATSSTAAYQTALASNLPVILVDIQQLKATQDALPADTKAIAQRCTRDVELVADGLQSINAAIEAKDAQAGDVARNTTNGHITNLTACISQLQATADVTPSAKR